MTTQEERIKILSMLQEGVINAEQAAKLLEALGSIGVESKSIPTGPSAPAYDRGGGFRPGKFFRYAPNLALPAARNRESRRWR